eukprot:393311_1
MTLDATRTTTQASVLLFQKCTFSIAFIVPEVDDYESCEEISHCKAMQRIIHLSNEFQSVKNNYMNDPPIYEYISSLTKYDVATFMEDWYHSKISHFKTDSDYDWVKNNIKSGCTDSTECMFLGRYGRDKGRETFDITGTAEHD